MADLNLDNTSIGLLIALPTLRLTALPFPGDQVNAVLLVPAGRLNDDFGKHPANGLIARVPRAKQCYLRLTATHFFGELCRRTMGTRASAGHLRIIAGYGRWSPATDSPPEEIRPLLALAGQHLARQHRGQKYAVVTRVQLAPDHGNVEAVGSPRNELLDRLVVVGNGMVGMRTSSIRA